MTRLRDRFASLTSRLVLTTVLLVLLVLVLIGTATTFAMRSYLTNQLDDDVKASAGRAYGPPGQPPGLGTGDRLEGQAPGTLLATISDTPSGRVVSEDRDDPATPLSDAALAQLADVPVDDQVHRIDLDGLGSYRVVALNALLTRQTTAGTTTSKVVALAGLPTSDIDAVVANLVEVEALLTLLAVVLAGGAALVVVRRQLRPLREVAATAHTVSELPLAKGDIDLTERVPDHLTDERTEVGQVGSALNSLLAHVEASLDARHRSEQQVRQFVADASHELRSPLATIAGYTELARRRPDDTATIGTALDKVEEESGRMTSLVEDLLLLARLDSGRPLERQPVDLTRLLLEAVSDARVLSPDHRWRLDVPDDAVDSAYEVPGDELRLHQVVTNLLTNAQRYTPAGTTVTVTVRRDGFSVHDDGPGLPPDLIDHAFERFARGDTARTRGNAVGVGLGLSLVQAIVKSHDGSVRLTSRPGDTTVDVTLPG
ncbi:MAG: ATP-binding region, ATPase domain protein [Nocardioides sp.]|nr:ATP-binding region, ATPase domain protein [Nocardioides sp.]